MGVNAPKFDGTMDDLSKLSTVLYVVCIMGLARRDAGF